MRGQNLFFFPTTDEQSAFCTEFSADLETTINTVLVAVQTLVKKREREQQSKQERVVKPGENDAFEDRFGGQNPAPVLVNSIVEQYSQQWNIALLLYQVVVPFVFFWTSIQIGGHVLQKQDWMDASPLQADTSSCFFL